MATPTALSPALKSYRQFKAQYPGYVLFFRMGDFYELFWEDARLAGSVLGIPITTRNQGTPHAVEMAGIPFHAVEAYLRRMIAAGHRCAICEMASPDGQRRKLVRQLCPAALIWIRIPGDAVSADLSRSGPYVISHRPGEHTLSYRPPGEHHQMGLFETEQAAKDAAQRHIEPPPKRQRRSLIADVERELREHSVPCIAVDDAKKALFANAKLKSFHFVVYDKVGDNWLLWCGEPTAAVREFMDQWAQVFGEGYQVVYAVRRKGGIVYMTPNGTRLAINGETARIGQT